VPAPLQIWLRKPRTLAENAQAARRLLAATANLASSPRLSELAHIWLTRRGIGRRITSGTRNEKTRARKAGIGDVVNRRHRRRGPAIPELQPGADEQVGLYDFFYSARTLITDATTGIGGRDLCPRRLAQFGERGASSISVRDHRLLRTR